MRYAPIPDLVGYEASEDGRVYSIRSGARRELKPRLYKGYMQVTVAVWVNGRKERHRKSVHRLVLSAFKGKPCEEMPHTRHLNGIPTDNRISNLAWGSPKENAADSKAHGNLGYGMKSRRRKLLEHQVVEILRRQSLGESKESIASDFGIHPEYIPHLVDGRCWPHLERGRGG
mgnify:FL=1